MIVQKVKLSTVGLMLLAMMAIPPEAFSREETVCIQCHGGQAGHLSAPIAAWRGSVHEINGISCHDCHGGDPTDFAMAMSPERGFVGVPAEEEIPAFCGKCHVGVKEDYLQSAHGQALGMGGPHCAVCHGSHKVVEASLDLINPEDCSRCHAYGRASEIRATLADTDLRIVKLNDALSRMKKQGFDVGDLKGNVFAVRNDFHRLFHTVDIALVKEKAGDFDQRFRVIEKDIQSIRDEIRSRKVWGGGVVLLLLLAGVISLLLHKAYAGGD